MLFASIVVLLGALSVPAHTAFATVGVFTPVQKLIAFYGAVATVLAWLIKKFGLMSKDTTWTPRPVWCFSLAFVVIALPAGTIAAFGTIVVNLGRTALTYEGDPNPIEPGTARIMLGNGQANFKGKHVFDTDEKAVPSEYAAKQPDIPAIGHLVRKRLHAFCPQRWGIGKYTDVPPPLIPLKPGSCEVSLAEARAKRATFSLRKVVPGAVADAADVRVTMGPQFSDSAAEFFDPGPVNAHVETWARLPLAQAAGDKTSLTWSAPAFEGEVAVTVPSGAHEIGVPRGNVVTVANGQLAGALLAAAKSEPDGLVVAKFGAGAVSVTVDGLCAWTPTRTTDHWLACTSKSIPRTGKVEVLASPSSGERKAFFEVPGQALPDQISIVTGQGKDEKKLGTIRCEAPRGGTFRVGRRSSLPPTCRGANGELSVGTLKSKWVGETTATEAWYCWPATLTECPPVYCDNLSGDPLPGPRGKCFLATGGTLKPQCTHVCVE
ncbi:MAG: hypothetical protein KF819_23865 [Labilithrix sp.]|nr:hypothetical protein [Labilithrix sp.]